MKPWILTRFIFGLGLLALRAWPSEARPAAYRVNVREGCRQSIAGAYLKVYDEKERLRTLIRALTEQTSGLKPLLDAARRDDRLAAETLAKASFEADVAARRGATAAHLQALEEQLKDTEAQLAKAQKEHAAAVLEEARLRAQISPVFEIKRTQDKPDGGYPLELIYRADCPKYRHLCPLPDKLAESLARIRIDEGLPEACQRYLSLGKWSKQ